MITEIQSKALRFFVSFGSGFIAILKPTVDTVLLCFIFILFDIFSAWDLSKRLKVKYNIKDNDFGKFTSEKAGHAIDTIIKLMILILGANVIDFVLLENPINLSAYMAVAFCAWELWSVLENFSSENDRGWAKFLQKFMVNKAKRHLNGIDVEEVLQEVKDEMKNESKDSTKEN